MNDRFKTCAKTAEIFREGSRINTTHKRNHTVGTCSNSWQEDPEQGLELPIYRLKTKKKIELSVPLWPARWSGLNFNVIDINDMSVQTVIDINDMSLTFLGRKSSEGPAKALVNHILAHSYPQNSSEECNSTVL